RDGSALRPCARGPSPGQRLRSHCPSLTIAAGLLILMRVSASAASACDLDAVRAQAQQSLPDCHIDMLRSEGGIVTLRCTPRTSGGTVAVALHAVGTQLFTSVASAGTDATVLARISDSVASWWKQALLQSALIACSAGMPFEIARAPAPALSTAAEAMIPP